MRNHMRQCDIGIEATMQSSGWWHVSIWMGNRWMAEADERTALNAIRKAVVNFEQALVDEAVRSYEAKVAEGPTP